MHSQGAYVIIVDAVEVNTPPPTEVVFHVAGRPRASTSQSTIAVSNSVDSNSSAGVATLSHPTPGGDTYYLVVPHNLLFDGSLGVTGTSTERPAGPAACRPRAIDSCE